MNEQRIHILYVDDSPFDRVLVRDALEKEHDGFLVTEASSRAQFEERLEEPGYDLVLSDFNILGFDGLQVVDLIRKRAPHLPVVIVTGTGSEEIAVEAMKRGVADYIIKTPKHIRRLPHTLLAVLENVHLKAEKKRAEQALLEAQSHLQVAVQAAGIGFWDWNIDTGEVYFSPEWKRQLGYADDELQNRIDEWEARLHPDDAAEATAHVQACLANPLLDYEAEFRLRHRDHSHRWIYTRAAIRTDAGGKPIRMMGCHVDVTSYREMQENLAEQSRRQTAIAELGRLALAANDIQLLMNVAVDLVQRTLDAPLINVLELLPDSEQCIVRAGVGWKDGVIGKAVVEADTGSQAGYTLQADEPVYVTNTNTELRFSIPQLLSDHGAICGVSVTINGAIHPYGVLSVHMTHLYDFTEEDLSFIQTVANVLAGAVDRHRADEHIEAGRERLQELSQRLVDLQELERKALAQELHDEIGQTLTGMKLSLQAGLRQAEGEIADRLAQSLEITQHLLDNIRELSLNLRPPMLDDLGLLHALLWLFKRFTDQTGIRIDFKQSGLETRPEARVETAAFRIVQEALNNVARHAGVKEVSIRLTAHEKHLLIEIEDCGAGFDLQEVMQSRVTGGLTGMQERTTLLGGVFALDTSPGQGTHLHITLPINR